MAKPVITADDAISTSFLLVTKCAFLGVADASAFAADKFFHWCFCHFLPR